MTKNRKLTFDRADALRYATYARMSSDAQNPRSPELQVATIRNEIRRQGLIWTESGNYQDAGITGRVIAKRPGFVSLLEGIQLGRIQIDAILVDTSERLGGAKRFRSYDISSGSMVYFCSTPRMDLRPRQLRKVSCSPRLTVGEEIRNPWSRATWYDEESAMPSLASCGRVVLHRRGISLSLRALNTERAEKLSCANSHRTLPHDSSWNTFSRSPTSLGMVQTASPKLLTGMLPSLRK